MREGWSQQSKQLRIRTAHFRIAMIKRWTAKLFSWGGPWDKPRKNQKVKTRLVRAKTLEALEKKLVKARFRDFELIGERVDPGGYFSSRLKESIKTARERIQDEKRQLSMYTVSWKREVNASTPRQAVSKARAIFCSSSTDELRFEVTDSSGRVSTVEVRKRQVIKKRHLDMKRK